MKIDSMDCRLTVFYSSMGSLSLRWQDLVPGMVPALHAILYYGPCYISAPLLSSSLF